MAAEVSVRQAEYTTEPKSEGVKLPFLNGNTRGSIHNDSTQKDNPFSPSRGTGNSESIDNNEHDTRSLERNLKILEKFLNDSESEQKVLEDTTAPKHSSKEQSGMDVYNEVQTLRQQLASAKNQVAFTENQIQNLRTALNEANSKNGILSQECSSMKEELVVELSICCFDV